MAFLPHAYIDGEVRPWQYLPADDDTYTVGQALVLQSGHLVTVSSGVGEDTDEGIHYVCMADTTIATDGDLLPVVQSEEEIIWEAPLSVQSASIAVGNVYTLNTDGTAVTATATKGCFKVVSFDGTAAGDLVRGILI